MPSSTCAKCGHQLFEVINHQPGGTHYTFTFVQCAQCGVPIAVLDSQNVGTMLQAQNRELESLASRLSAVESLVQQVLQLLEAT